MDKKGQTALVGGVVVILTAAILIFISMLVVNKVRTSMDGDVYNSTYNVTSGVGRLADQDTYDDLVDNGNAAMSLAGIALIVVVAFLIITILRG